MCLYSVLSPSPLGIPFLPPKEFGDDVWFKANLNHCFTGLNLSLLFIYENRHIWLVGLFCLLCRFYIRSPVPSTFREKRILSFEHETYARNQKYFYNFSDFYMRLYLSMLVNRQYWQSKNFSFKWTYLEYWGFAKDCVKVKINKIQTRIMTIWDLQTKCMHMKGRYRPVLIK